MVFERKKVSKAIYSIDKLMTYALIGQLPDGLRTNPTDWLTTPDPRLQVALLKKVTSSITFFTFKISS